jgi:hypothetical protein
VPDTLPRTIGRYEIRRELGRGMMGVVYEALDPALGRIIALKTIQLAFAVDHERRRSFEERFLTEARAAASLSHPGIVVVHDVGQDSATGTLYIALEFLEGHTLAKVVEAGKPIEWREALGITRTVAQALHHAHTHGVIHRDIKPANIMILPTGEPKIMDFGIAKVETSHLTATGQFFGTPLYMSPEQAQGQKVDARSDLFSLGALAYALLTGQQPFAAEGVPRILVRVLQDDPPPPTRVIPGLPPDVDYLIARALAKNPGDRYPDGQTLAEDIDDILANKAPRHKQGSDLAGRAEGTVVASRRSGLIPDTPNAPPLAGAPLPKPAAGRLTPPPVPAAVRRRPPPRPAQAPAPSRPPRSVPLWAVAAGGAGFAVVLVAVALVAVLTTRSLRKQAPPAPPPASTTTPLATPDEDQPVRVEVPDEDVAGTARVDLDLEHSLRRGKLRVWVDNVLVVEDDLDSRVARKIATVKIRKGHFERALDIPAGRHEIKVQVAWDGNTKTASAWANLAPGSTRQLSAKIGTGITGLVKKDLDLEWE